MTTTQPATTTTTQPPATPSTFPVEVVQDYLKQLLTAEVGVSDLVNEIIGISNDWDNRSETDVTYGATEEAMEAAVERMQAALVDFDLISAPPTGDFPPKHLTVVSAAGQVAESAAEMLAGLQSADTGEQRQAAQVGLNAAYGVFIEGIDAIIAEYIGDDEITALIVSRNLTAPAPADPEETASEETTSEETTSEETTSEEPTTTTTEPSG
ncbi:MAG: hypothetical protein KTV45_15270 [Acidimicrobiia bacterium]|nr:hypothetical protein [Acidimicrobiia bacterium]